MSIEPFASVVAKTVERGFDWGSAVIGAGSGAAVTLLVLVFAMTLRSHRAGSHPRGGRQT